MALPDIGIAPPDVREAATEPSRMMPSHCGRDITGRVEVLYSAAQYVPGVTQEVPVLEKPPVIGVVEDDDGPSRASTIPTHTLSTSSANPSEAR